jgi:hypothetical protein
VVASYRFLRSIKIESKGRSKFSSSSRLVLVVVSGFRYGREEECEAGGIWAVQCAAVVEEVVVTLPSLLGVAVVVVVLQVLVVVVVSKTDDDDDDAVTAVVVVAGDIFSILLLYEENI